MSESLPRSPDKVLVFVFVIEFVYDHATWDRYDFEISCHLVPVYKLKKVFDGCLGFYFRRLSTGTPDLDTSPTGYTPSEEMNSP